MEDACWTILLAVAETSTTTYALFAISALFVGFVVLKPFFRKRDSLASSPFRFSMSQQKSIERDMQNLLVELHEMARTMTAQIETRAAKLELLIRDADERLARLDRAGLTAGAASASSGAASRPAIAGTIPSAIDLPPSDAQAIMPPMARTHPPQTRQQSNLEPADDRYAEVYSLSDDALSVQEIATRLKRPAGEIELILALRPNASVDTSEPPAIATT